MKLLNFLSDIAKGATVGVATVVALPVFGPIGTATALGVAIGSTLGASASLVDKFLGNED